MNNTDYFEYNGARYYSGTKFTMKEYMNQQLLRQDMLRILLMASLFMLFMSQ